MRAMTRTEVRAAIVNLDPAQKKLHLPGWFDDIGWERLDYLGWRDLRDPNKCYIVADIDGEATGVALRQYRNQAALGSRAIMCDLCRFTRKFNEVSRFAAPRPSRDKRQRLSTAGMHVCADLDCAENVHSKPHVGPLDPPADDVIARRRHGLRERTEAFIHIVSPAHADGRA